mmetsp:Transcript_20474/g.20590  ORF Transcript_20474/g.20590 Transcript_20474/m.20590 type:complete len:94 (-) Transcript_20474:86-367(-)
MKKIGRIQKGERERRMSPEPGGTSTSPGSGCRLLATRALQQGSPQRVRESGVITKHMSPFPSPREIIEGSVIYGIERERERERKINNHLVSDL